MNPNQGAFQAAVQLASESLATIGHIGETLLNGELDAAGYEHLSNHVKEAERAVSNLRASLISLAPRKTKLGESSISSGTAPVYMAREREAMTADS